LSDDNYPAFHDSFEDEPYSKEISGVQMSTTELPVTKRNTCRFRYVQVNKELNKKNNFVGIVLVTQNDTG